MFDNITWFAKIYHELTMEETCCSFIVSERTSCPTPDLGRALQLPKGAEMVRGKSHNKFISPSDCQTKCLE